MSAIEPTTRTSLRRLPERASYDRASIYDILDEGLLCHLALVHDGDPIVVPTLYGRDDDHLVLHGSPASRALRMARGPRAVSVNVTLVDGIVVARSAFHSSMNYRSVTIFGEAEAVVDHREKIRLLRIVVDHVIPHRTSSARPMTDKEVKGTMVLRIPIEEASAKVRTGWPKDDPEDYELVDVWAGVIPISTSFGAPLADPDLRSQISAPAGIAGYHRGGGPR